MGGGWSESDNKTISVQLNLTGTGTGTELGKMWKTSKRGGGISAENKKCRLLLII